MDEPEEGVAQRRTAASAHRDRLRVGAPGTWVATLTSVAFLLVHVIGTRYALLTLREAWEWRFQARIIADHLLTSLFGFRSAVAAWIASLSVAPSVVVLALGGVACASTVWRLLRRQPELHVGLRLRMVLYLAMACLFVNAFFLSTPETSTGPFRVRLPLTSSMSVTLAYGMYALWSLLLPRLQRAFPVRLGRMLDIFAMNAVLVLMLAELALRLAGTVWPTPLLVTQSTSSQVRLSANRERPGTVRFNFPINRGGHYDTEFLPDSMRRAPVVVSIGDSYSYGTVPHAFHFTTIAEQEVGGIEFYNMGFPDIGPNAYLYLLEHEALPLNPDLVIINLFMGNDVTDGAMPVVRPPRWHDADNYLLAVVWNRFSIMKRAELTTSPKAIREGRLSRQELALAYPWLADPLLEKPLFSREVYLDIESKSAASISSQRGSLFFGRFVNTLATLEAGAGDTPLAFMLIPAAFQVEDSIWADIVQESDQPLDRDLAHRVVLRWLRCRGTPVLDLLPVLKAVPPMEDGRRHLYHRQDTHFNVRGNEVAGRALASFVKSLQSAAPKRVPTCPPPELTPEPVPPALALPLRLDIGDSTARPWMRVGWNADETAGGQTFAWSDGDRSIVKFRLRSRGDVRVDFEVLPFVFPGSPPQGITVVLNGSVIEEVRLEPGLKKYSVVLPARALSKSVDALEFRYAYTRSPQEVFDNSPDVRKLSVAWYSIDFSPRAP